MRWIRRTGLGFIAALYVLAGRWGFHRLAEAVPETNAFLELRLWIVMGGGVLASLGLLHRAWREARPGEARFDGPLITALLGFFGYLCASASWSPDATFALSKLYDLTLVLVMSVGFGLAALRQPAPRVLDAFWTIIVAATALLALTGVRQLLSGGGGARLAVMGGGPNIFARLMGLLALGALYFWTWRGQAWLWIPVAATGVILALLTGSRGGTAAILAGVTTCLVVARVPLRRLLLLVLLATVAAGGVMASPLGEPLRRSVEERFLRLTLNYDGGGGGGRGRGGGGDGEVYLSGREVLYAAAIQLGRDHPVAGGGLAAFPALRLGVYPHNLFLELFCETGAVGLLLFAGVLLTFTRSALKRRQGLDGATVGAAVLVFLGSQSSGDLYDTRALFLLMVMATCTAVPGRSTAQARLPASPPLPQPAFTGAT
ncbi:O-antigen ligase family protein [Corallococcus llansteffanensis]|uniref:O-antigen ligase domain-containing protein n=1 Tax=Corallococcus llansteffanensis TaxID=2316731 RepID=A0A3A8PQ33_9BACT|nr:O-antigen ligase family protein [Corallococcus llansteffanensis]RKH58443.1 O-antigen ligase domain-containing protein [Corallococcus llansteffanensis]